MRVTRMSNIVGYYNTDNAFFGGGKNEVGCSLKNLRGRSQIDVYEGGCFGGEGGNPRKPSQDNQCSGRNSNKAPLEYMPKALLLHQRVRQQTSRCHALNSVFMLVIFFEFSKISYRGPCITDICNFHSMLFVSSIFSKIDE